MTFQHRAGVRPYTSPCGLAESCVFAKQSLPPGHCDPRCLLLLRDEHQRHTFFRSYGVNLPSSFWMVLSHALGCSPHLLVSDFGTGARTNCQRLFLGVWNQPFAFGSKLPTDPHHISVLTARLCHTTPRRSTYVLTLASDSQLTYPSPSPRAVYCPWRYRNINLFTIVYVCRPRLRIRLTLRGISLLEETLGLRRPGFSPGLSLLMSA